MSLFRRRAPTESSIFIGASVSNVELLVHTFRMAGFTIETAALNLTHAMATDAHCHTRITTGV